jgi:hypothetical protein
MEEFEDIFQPDFDYIVPETILAIFDKSDIHALKDEAKRLCVLSEVNLTCDPNRLNKKQLLNLCGQLLIFHKYILVKDNLGH